MSLDVYLTEVRPTVVFESNITHNLGEMAEEAGLYQALWAPEELGIKTAAELAPLLQTGLAKLLAEPDRFRAYDSPNGWGIYDDFVPFVERHLRACVEHPTATVSVSR